MKPSSQIHVRLIALLLLLISAGATAPASIAQEFNRVQRTQSSLSYRFFAEPGMATMRVAFLSSSERQGFSGLALQGNQQQNNMMLTQGASDNGFMAEVPVETDLATFLVLVGGKGVLPIETSDFRTSSVVTILRMQDGQRQEIFRSDTYQLYLGNTTAPALQEGDTVVLLSTTKTKWWRDSLLMLTTAASALFLVNGLLSLGGN